MKPTPAPLGLYLHIPFCRSKCVYCDFYSLPRSEDRMDAYADALCAHLTETAPFAANHLVDTVYFGGGTPSYLGAKRLAKILKVILKKFRVAKDAEITLEANPDSAGDWKALRTLRKCGFNRISLGMQSAQPQELADVHRPHTPAQTDQAVTAAKKAGFRNLSLDLIYGLPGQTLSSWLEGLGQVLIDGYRPDKGLLRFCVFALLFSEGSEMIVQCGQELLLSGRCGGAVRREQGKTVPQNILRGLILLLMQIQQEEPAGGGAEGKGAVLLLRKMR